MLLAWKSFGGGNGAATYEEFLERLRSMRHGQPILESEELGCIMLRSLVMFPRDDWIQEPSDWEPNIVQGPCALPALQGQGPLQPVPGPHSTRAQGLRHRGVLRSLPAAWPPGYDVDLAAELIMAEVFPLL